MNSTGGRRLRRRYPEANHEVVGGWECRAARGGRGAPVVPQGGVNQPTAGVGLRLLQPQLGIVGRDGHLASLLIEPAIL
jgi:hypothetical protein